MIRLASQPQMPPTMSQMMILVSISRSLLFLSRQQAAVRGTTDA
jgi:hypothetical protein